MLAFFYRSFCNQDWIASHYLIKVSILNVTNNTTENLRTRLVLYKRFVLMSAETSFFFFNCCFGTRIVPIWADLYMSVWWCDAYFLKSTFFSNKISFSTRCSSSHKNHNFVLACHFVWNDSNNYQLSCIVVYIESQLRSRLFVLPKSSMEKIAKYGIISIYLSFPHCKGFRSVLIASVFFGPILILDFER
jgi:hypothetical protein